MKHERLWYRDDLTGPQRAGLVYLRDETPTGGAYAGFIRRRVRLVTLRALHRLGLVMGNNGDVLQPSTFVMLTSAGTNSISDVARRTRSAG